MRQLLCLIVLLNLLLIAPAYTCTMFRQTSNGKTWVGNNEDFDNPYTWMWTEQGKKGRLGAVYFGYSNFFAQGGINEKGLVFDGFTTPYIEPEKNAAGRDKDPAKAVHEIMTTCGTVEEVLAVLSGYHLKHMERSQLMFADRNGKSVIIEPNRQIISDKSYQIATNFYQSCTPEVQITCNRFLKAKEMLELNSAPSLETVNAILDATHQEGFYGGTQYSTIYDLHEGIVYLSLFHNFKEVIKLSVRDLLAQEDQKVELKDLFRERAGYDAYRKNYEESRKMAEMLLQARDSSEIRDLVSLLKQMDETKMLGGKLLQASEVQKKEKKYNNALMIIQLCLFLFPDSWEVHTQTAGIYYSRADYSNAMLHIRKAIELNPGEAGLKESLEKIGKGSKK